MKRSVILVFFSSFAGALWAQQPTALAIHNARIVPVSGPVIAKGTVVVRDGLIETVGANVDIPADAWVVEGDGLTVYPGLIDSLSTIGLPDEAPAPPNRGPGGGTNVPAPAQPAAPASTTPPARGPEDRPNTYSWRRTADLIKTSDHRLEVARSAGFTSAVTFSHRGIFAGQGTVIDLAGETSGKMIVAENAGQYVTLVNGGFGSGYPASLLGVFAYIRQIYLDADHYKKARQMYAAHPTGMLRPDYDRALEGVLDSPQVLLPATRRIDVDRMIRFANEVKIRPVLYGIPEAYRSVDLLKRSGVPVLLSLKWPAKPVETNPDDVDELRQLEIRDQAPSAPALLAKNQVKFAFFADGMERRADLFPAVKKALDAGLSEDDAVRALTLTPAEIYGVADRLGSIEKGKIANLVVTKGDLFQDKTEVKFVVIDGVKYEPVEEPPVRPEGARLDRAGSESQ
ncbi:MAG TPA: amidohydrolase family protein [Bryobacteraceae bacterium]|nr:amidohydrolase family protein [Bryobacteraceae bacterium]